MMLSLFKPSLLRGFEMFKQKLTQRRTIIEKFFNDHSKLQQSIPFYPSHTTVQENMIIDIFMSRLTYSSRTILLHMRQMRDEVISKYSVRT